MSTAFLKQMNSNTRDPQDTRSFVQAQILDAAHQLACGLPQAAEQLIEPFLTIAYSYASPEERLGHFFARSIYARIGSQIQLPRCNGDRALQAFAACTPFTAFGMACANAAILRSIMGAERALIVDLEMREAIQWRALLDLLAVNPLCPRQLHIVGMASPQAAGREDLLVSSIMSCSEKLGVNLTVDVMPFATDTTIINAARAVRRSAETAVIINAVEALNRVAANDIASAPNQRRDVLLRDLAALKPRLLTLVEPDVEHNALPFSARVCASWHYHRAVFETLSTCFPSTSPERIAIEQQIFGPNIHNVVVAEHTERTERQERWRSWARRLQAQGFRQLSLEHHHYYVDKATRPPAPVSIGAEDGALMLRWGTIPMMAASAWSL